MAATRAQTLRVEQNVQRRARPRPDHSRLTVVQPSYRAPWLFAALERIHEIENNPRDFPGVANLVVTQQTAMYARSVLGSLVSPDLPSPVVCPLSGGALGVAWSVGARELEVVIYPSNETSFVISNGGVVIADDTFAQNDTDSLEDALTQLLGA
jgi:hypothetical protein